MAEPLEETVRDTPGRAQRAATTVLRTLHSPDRDLPAEVPLTIEPLAIGRAPSGARSLTVRDPRLSRSHAALFVERGEIRVRDSSTNGTFVGGNRIRTEAALADGDVLRTGDTFFVVRVLPAELRDAPIDELVGRAPAIAALRAEIALVASARATVLITGESGTGKELVARAIHERSKRKGRFVAVNCGAIPEALAESELFGHVSGAFTGARDAHLGFFRQAHEGTLFLDEIGEMPLATQARLLRAMEEGAVQPVGADRAVPVDVRVVCATNRDLQRAAREQRFRGDLFARITDITLRTPPLRARREDVLPIFQRALGPDAPPVAADLADGLLNYDWPYNVRELAKVAAEARLRGAGKSQLTLELVAARLMEPTADLPALEADGDAAEPDRSGPPPDAEIRALWESTGGNVSEMSRALGRSRRQVRRYLETLGLRGKD